MLIVCDRNLTIGPETFTAGRSFDVEDWRGLELIQAGTARPALPPEILYEASAQQQNADNLGEQGVTCLCLTRNRRQWLPKAIACYLAQDYQPRELLIVADGEDVADLVPKREDIRLIHIEEGRLIGDKRNFGVNQARGQYVAHWDDDDWNAADRISGQVAQIQKTGKSLIGFSSMHFTNGQGWWMFEGGAGYVVGTSMFYPRSWALSHPFPIKQVGEDGEFFKTAHAAQQIASVPAGFVTVGSVHDGNTSPRSFTHGVGMPNPAELPDDCRKWAASIAS